MKFLSKNDHRAIYLVLWALCVIGSLCLIPFVYYLGIFPSSMPIGKVILLNLGKSSIFFGIICWLSYKIVPKTDLRPFSFENPLKEILYPALISGAVVSFTIFIFDKTLFKGLYLSGIQPPPVWARAISSIYGAVNEEVLLRLFLFTLLYFLLGKCFSMTGKTKLISLWSINIVVAIIFGLGHLPAAYKIARISNFEFFRILFLNSVAGVVFGWLYWTRGLFTAIAAHLVTDLVMHVCFI